MENIDFGKREREAGEEEDQGTAGVLGLGLRFISLSSVSFHRRNQTPPPPVV
ncbi:hypothetical protein HanXRQr2_Chr04g0147821 [Helianthus annuus]|uniref:Uncharacterized protein n=1 Tax=Helianthus annuus TaxID=4232 RepID=A0A251UWT7_HELAN|nr:hypothetical protein HanXRQr2_Chr04g0147821 [Helianthus annuus]